MTALPRPSLLNRLRHGFVRAHAAGLTDGQLLELFVSRHDQTAFAALVRRHGPMVYSVCRRIVGRAQDAEDAFQATFLVLARKAASVRPRQAVGNWLYGVAYRTARRAKALLARRRVREQQVATMPEPVLDPVDSLSDLEPILDQELNGLPDNYRLPIVLCDLEGRTRKEVARQLGLPEGTLSGRLTLGRRMLAKRLARRGLALSAGALGTLLAKTVASAGVPTAVMSSTVEAAGLFATGQPATGVASAKVAALTEGVLKAMFLTNLKNCW